MLSSLDKSPDAANLELVERHRALYEGRRSTPHSRTSFATPPSHVVCLGYSTPAPFARRDFDSHVVEVVSSHQVKAINNAFASRPWPDFRSDHASRVRHGGVDLETFGHTPPTGIITTSSDARLLAQRTSELLAGRLPLRVVLTPFNRQTGKIGFRSGQRNDRHRRNDSWR